ncbi:LacI family DNA-binding transcriptional regulator [Cerasicoccus frondis]|uniref:LacI family DNA-binding transcriptional regulator n=1 Tax=Cerasicoccus frondis TaxID=490090 RepID=UPI002852AD90|nr:LacI family DNA-binding transcriptional regulator [Cerasicoccus frondis]
MNEDKRSRPVNMWDIAKEANVSQSTVSRALRNDPRITETVRLRVSEAAKKLNYRPNPFVSALTAQVRSFRAPPSGATIGLLNCMPKWQMPMPYFKLYSEGATKRAEELGFSTEFFHLEDLDNSISAVNRILWSRSIIGLLVMPVPSGVDLSELKFENLVSATVDTSLRSPMLHRATANYFQGMSLALDKLKSKGYKRIGFCTHEDELGRIGARWHGAYLHWHSINGIKPLQAFVAKTYDPQELKAWCQRAKPDVIVTNRDDLYDHLSEVGIRIPEDVSFVALNAECSKANVSGVNQHNREIAEAGIEMVVNQIYHNEYGLSDQPKSLEIKSSWIEGQSAPDKH